MSEEGQSKPLQSIKKKFKTAFSKTSERKKKVTRQIKRGISMSTKAEVSAPWSFPKKGGSRSEGKHLNIKDSLQTKGTLTASP